MEKSLYEYRIIELGTFEYPTFDFDVSPSIANRDPSWFVVEYRKINSGSKTWFRLTYNMERYLRYRDSCIWKEESKPHVCSKDATWDIGFYIPSYELAEKLMNEHKEKMKKEPVQRRVVYDTSIDYEPTHDEDEISKLVNAFNKLLGKK